VRQCEQELASCFGLRPNSRRSATPRPGVTFYDGLELADPETGETPCVVFPWNSGSIDGRARDLGHDPEIETGRFGAALDVAPAALAARSWPTEGEVAGSRPAS